MGEALQQEGRRRPDAAERDAPVVARMRRAGAILLGKTNVPILSHTGSHANDSWAGPTINVPMPDRAGRQQRGNGRRRLHRAWRCSDLAEETGGSIQNPASAQDLVGIKPTIGLVPNAGVVPLSGNRDVVGPIARNVRDAALCSTCSRAIRARTRRRSRASAGSREGGYTSALSPDA